MKCRPNHPLRAPSDRGFTLTEVLVAAGLSSMVLAVVTVLSLFCLRSFAGMGNYATLSGQSRLGLDWMSREIREARQVVEVNTNLPVRWLTLSNNVEGVPLVVKINWDSTTGVLSCDKTGQPTRTILTGCDEWDFHLFLRAPTNGWYFYPTTDLQLCKLVSMSWKCSRSMLGEKVNTEDVLTAQIVLRNKP
jgi:Tfp pilus assembly protein PilW